MERRVLNGHSVGTKPGTQWVLSRVLTDVLRGHAHPQGVDAALELGRADEACSARKPERRSECLAFRPRGSLLLFGPAAAVARLRLYVRVLSEPRGRAVSNSAVACHVLWNQLPESPKDLYIATLYVAAAGNHNPGFQTVILPVPLVRMDRAHTRGHPAK